MICRSGSHSRADHRGVGVLGMFGHHRPQAGKHLVHRLMKLGFPGVSPDRLIVEIGDFFM
jgi:hypothetical protein